MQLHSTCSPPSFCEYHGHSLIKAVRKLHKPIQNQILQNFPTTKTEQNCIDISPQNCTIVSNYVPQLSEKFKRRIQDLKKISYKPLLAKNSWHLEITIVSELNDVFVLRCNYKELCEEFIDMKMITSLTL